VTPADHLSAIRAARTRAETATATAEAAHAHLQATVRAAVTDHAHVSHVAREAGVTRQTVYKWLNHQEDSK